MFNCGLTYQLFIFQILHLLHHLVKFGYYSLRFTCGLTYQLFIFQVLHLLHHLVKFGYYSLMFNCGLTYQLFIFQVLHLLHHLVKFGYYSLRFNCGLTYQLFIFQVLHLLHHLVKFGYYMDLDDVRSLLVPLLSLLDGRHDVPYPKDHKGKCKYICHITHIQTHIHFYASLLSEPFDNVHRYIIYCKI